jgi:hypothetical protein
MKRLVFTIVEGFIGGSRSGDRLLPLELEDAGHDRLRHADGRPPHAASGRRGRRPEASQQHDSDDTGVTQAGAADPSTGYA